MGVLEGVLLVAAIVVAGWAGYRTGWDEHSRHVREAVAADERAWTELNLIFLVRDDEELARADREQGTDALGRLRRMSPKTVEDFRAAKGILYEVLSDRLAALSRRTEQARVQVADYPLLAQLFERLDERHREREAR